MPLSKVESQNLQSKTINYQKDIKAKFLTKFDEE